MRLLFAGSVVLAGLLVLPLGHADSPAQARSASERTSQLRGKKALLTKVYDPARFSWPAYENAGRFWGLEKRPDGADYDRFSREGYGLHPAPSPTGGLRMGLRKGARVPPRRKGISFDCMVCHGGSIFGQS